MTGPGLRQMRYLVKVAELGSFTAAAAELYVAQQAVSHQVKAIEQMLGVTLLRRGPGGVTPTEAGAVFVRSARELVEAADRLTERTRAAARGEVGTVRIGYTNTASADTVPRLVGAITDALPGLEVSTREVISGEVESLFADDVVDLAVMPHAVRPAGLAWQALRDETLMVGMSETHALASEPSLGLGDLRHECFVQAPRHRCPTYHDLLVEQCRAAGFEPRLVSPTGATWMQVTVAGSVTLVARSMASIVPGGVRLVALRPRCVLPISLVWSAETQAPAVGRVRAVAEAVAERFDWLRADLPLQRRLVVAAPD